MHPPVFFLRPPSCLFILAEWKQRRKWEGVYLGSLLWSIRSQLSLRVGMSAGGGVGSGSCGTESEMFDFCDNISWDVAAELLLWGVMFCIRPSNGF